MYEIERKFRLSEAEAESVRAQLDTKYGPGKKLVQKDELFLYNKSSYGEHITGEPTLRIRSSDGKHYFTYKHTVIETGNRVEHETEIDDPEAMRAALIAMGWRNVIRIEKVRLHYHTDDITFELDSVDGLGSFLEVEIVSDTDSVKEPQLVAIAERFGVTIDQIERSSYGKLVWEKQSAR